MHCVLRTYYAPYYQQRSPPLIVASVPSKDSNFKCIAPSSLLRCGRNGRDPILKRAPKETQCGVSAADEGGTDSKARASLLSSHLVGVHWLRRRVLRFCSQLKQSSRRSVKTRLGGCPPSRGPSPPALVDAELPRGDPGRTGGHDSSINSCLPWATHQERLRRGGCDLLAEKSIAAMRSVLDLGRPRTRLPSQAA